MKFQFTPHRSRETIADLHIERIGDGGQLPGPLTAKLVDDGLKSASTLVAGAAMLFARYVEYFSL